MPYTNTLHLPHSCVWHPISSKARLTESQHKERSARSCKCQAEIEDAVHEWKAYTLTLATDLGRRFNKKPRYFLDLFFQGGVHLATKQGKVNAHNAFLAMKAQELRQSMVSIVPFMLFFNSRESWLRCRWWNPNPRDSPFRGVCRGVQIPWSSRAQRNNGRPWKYKP